MGKEIERKFLVDTSIWKPQGTSYQMSQAYLVIHPEKVIRVRISNDKAYLTIKGNRKGISRNEFEYEIPLSDAQNLMSLSEIAPVVKTRWKFDFAGKTWEVDIFDGANKGLVVAEIELESEDEVFEKPDWVTEEVSTDVKYYNFSLAQNPFCNWQ